jgi:hypothetical protein
MKNITSYQLNNRQAVLFLTSGKVLVIDLTPKSGNVYCRTKVGTLSDVKHTGIFFGNDAAGNRYFMHNHFKTGKPSIVTKNEFTLGMPLSLYEGETINTPLQTVQCGLEQVMAGEPYSWLSYNCQTFVNHARRNTRVSEDVDRWEGGAALALIVLLGINLINN